MKPTLRSICLNLGFIVSHALLWGCDLSVSIQGRPCPCPQGYKCCAATTCTPEDQPCTCQAGFKYCPSDTCAAEGGLCSEALSPIQAGTFWMGSPCSQDPMDNTKCICPASYDGDCSTPEEGRLGISNTQPDDEKLHFVQLTRPFEMMTTEVTQQHFVRLTGWNPSVKKHDQETDEYPVSNITWFDALVFANLLSVKMGYPPCYELTAIRCKDDPVGQDGDPVALCYARQRSVYHASVGLAGSAASPYSCKGFRLPTESEWEYAARAGTITPYYNGSPTGDYTTGPDTTLDSIAWYNSLRLASSVVGDMDCSKVGQKQPNAWGLYDMLGNVWEWVYDSYQEQLPICSHTAPCVDPFAIPELGNSRSRRGGSFMSVREYCRSANRGYCVVEPVGDEPSGDCIFSNTATGFRLVRTMYPDH